MWVEQIDPRLVRYSDYLENVAAFATENVSVCGDFDGRGNCVRNPGHDAEHERVYPDDTMVCFVCGKLRDAEVVKRNRRNRQRGTSLERSIAKQYGGRRTGPLGGRDDVVTDSMFAIQSKRSLRLSLNEARAYLADLHRIFPRHTPLVVHRLPRERTGVVIVDERDWLALHGPTHTEGSTP